MRTLFSHIFLFVLFSLLLAVFVGFAGCAKRSTPAVSIQTQRDLHRDRAININTATREELEELPHVGAVLAERIIKHRDRYGPFRKREHLLAIEGLSEKRYRELKQFIDTK